MASVPGDLMKISAGWRRLGGGAPAHPQGPTPLPGERGHFAFKFSVKLASCDTQAAVSSTQLPPKVNIHCWLAAVAPSTQSSGLHPGGGSNNMKIPGRHSYLCIHQEKNKTKTLSCPSLLTQPQRRPLGWTAQLPLTLKCGLRCSASRKGFETFP